MNLHTPIPSFINKKSNIVRLIIYTSVFALVFINIYTPFGSADWYNLPSKFMFFFYSSIMILIGMLVVLISRIIMYQWCKKHRLQVLWFAVWIFGEILAMGAIYALLSLAIDPSQAFAEILPKSILKTSAVLLLPYAICYLIFSLKEKSEQLKMEQDQEMVIAQNVLSFYDEKKELKLSIKKENLLYIESEDNYVNVYYTNKGKISKYLLRNTLKVLEKEFEGSNVLRCHRSYMINIEQVTILRKEKGGGIFVEFGSEEIVDIPVTKTYSEVITRAFVESHS